jgi:hypothetical protein
MSGPSGIETEQRPWGSYTILEDEGTRKVKRIENVADTDIVFVEVQHGEYFGEDDIVRIEDDFGRVDP